MRAGVLVRSPCLKGDWQLIQKNLGG